MAPGLLARLFDRGRAGAQRLGGQAPPPAEPALPTPIAAEPAEPSEERLDQTASREELAALRLALSRELDRLALRETSTAPGTHR